MQRQVYSAVYKPDKLTYFFDINEAGELVKTISIPSEFINGSIMTLPPLPAAWQPRGGIDVQARLSYNALSSLNPGSQAQEFYSKLYALTVDGHLCYRLNGIAHGAYLASISDISEIKDFSDCSIPIMHISLLAPAGAIGLIAQKGTIKITPHKISISLQEGTCSTGELSKFLLHQKLFQIMR